MGLTDSGCHSLDSTSRMSIGGTENEEDSGKGVAVPERGKLGVTGVPILEGSSSTMKRTRYRWN